MKRGNVAITALFVAAITLMPALTFAYVSNADESAAGSLLYDEFGNIHTVPTAKIRLINATGAGDSMVAGFVAKTDAGEDYETALRFASACGSATAASKGIAKRSTIMRVFAALDKVIAEQQE